MPFGEKNYHKSKDALHVGCENPRAYFIPFDDEDSAKLGVREYSKRFRSLIGTWDFKFYPSVLDIEKDSIFDIECDEKMCVPMNWQHAQGRQYDKIQYTNVDYPFPVDPPFVPNNNPCAIYRRSFSLEKDFIENREVFINFEGVDSCFYLYINGRFAAYSEVSHMTSEINVTKLVHEGENEIRLLVLKWCTGSYLEDQDMFRSSGIFREVFLLSRDKTRIDDIKITPSLNDSFDEATFSVKLKAKGDAEVGYFLYDGDEKVLDKGKIVARGTAEFDFKKISRPMLWSDENPYLYTAEFRVGGEIIRIKCGARRVEIVGNVVLINGKKVKAKGVNRHDSHPLLGHATPTEHMLRDLYILKAHNVNTIRTSHYPNDPRFLEMCDELGFYVCDETDLECHGIGIYKDSPMLTDDPEWTEIYLDRAKRMLERDKNHPCIIMWSVGNESGPGINHKAMSEYFKSEDSTRLVHVEDESRRAALIEDNIAKGTYKGKHTPDILRSYIDIESRMYCDLDTLKQKYLGKDARFPIFLCEYAHAMGVGPGGLNEYWELIYKHDNFFGGCVWEYCDHAAVSGENVYLKPEYLYGGDHGEFPHFNSFCVDGLVYPDRRPHTGMKELKEVLKPFRAEYQDGKLKITSLRRFTSLSDLTLYYTVEKNGKIVTSGCLGDMKILPEKSKTYQLPVSADGYTTLNVYAKQNTATAWADIGYEVGFVQFVLSDSMEERVAEPKRATLSENNRYFNVTVGETSYRINKCFGLIDSIVTNGKEMLASQITPVIWRSPTDNDRHARKLWETYYYNKAEVNCRKSSSKADGERVKIFTEVTVGPPAITPLFVLSLTYTFGDGEGVHIDCRALREMDLPWGTLPPMPRFGFMVRMPEGSENVRYFGYGPGEAYEDIHLSSRISAYKTTATDNFEHYIRPQENSAHYGCKWADVTSADGHGLYFSAKTFSLSVSHYEPHYLTGFAHDFELRPEKETTVIIDYRNAGIGSNSCGPDLLPEYKISEKEFSFSFNILPVFAGNIIPEREYRE